MSDLISREALMEKMNKRLDDLRKKHGQYDHYTDGFDDAVDMVMDFPAAEAEPVRWEKIPGFIGLYEINPLSQIRNADGKILKQQIRREKYTCYKVVHLWKDGKYHQKGVHRLMAETFLPNPDGLPVVNHKDEDGTNNLLCNLEWCDRSYNASYGTSPKKISRAFKGKASEKRIPVQQLKDGKIVKEYACAGIAEKETGISMSNIRLVCRGVRKRAGGFEWRYSAKMDGGAEE